MNQNQNIKLIKKIFKQQFRPPAKLRFIKIHGSKFQEPGLPDLKILTSDKNYWFEIKRDWKDEPTPLQQWNIADLRNYNYITGFVADDEFKFNWGDSSIIKLVNLIKLDHLV